MGFEIIANSSEEFAAALKEGLAKYSALVEGGEYSPLRRWFNSPRERRLALPGTPRTTLPDAGIQKRAALRAAFSFAPPGKFRIRAPGPRPSRARAIASAASTRTHGETHAARARDRGDTPGSRAEGRDRGRRSRALRPGHPRRLQGPGASSGAARVHGRGRGGGAHLRRARSRHRSAGRQHGPVRRRHSARRAAFDHPVARRA